MTPAVNHSILSPSGRVSKRQRAAALSRAAAALEQMARSAHFMADRYRADAEAYDNSAHRTEMALTAWLTYARHRPTLPQDARSGAEGYGDMGSGEIGPQTGDGTLHSGEG